MIQRRFELAFTTRRGLSKFLVNTLAMFGGLSGLFQFYSAVFVPQDRLTGAGWITLAVAVASLGWGVRRALPKRQLQVTPKSSNFEIRVMVGDLFTLDSNIVVGFSDTFDTNTDRDQIISRNSVQGQLLRRFYGEDSGKLDSELANALASSAPLLTERAASKPNGKLDRYPIGTVVELQHAQNTIFGVAYTKMSNELRAQATVDGLWWSLSQVWSAVAASAQMRPIAIPVVGSELARISSLDRNNLIQLIVISFVSAARTQSVSRSLTVVVHGSDEEKINMLELEAFLKGF